MALFTISASNMKYTIIVIRVFNVLQTWNPKSKSEPYAQSVVELMSIAKEMVNGFFEIPIGITDDSVLDLAEGLEQLIQEYTTFVASCGEYKTFALCFIDLSECRVIYLRINEVENFFLRREWAKFNY